MVVLVVMPSKVIKLLPGNKGLIKVFTQMGLSIYRGDLENACQVISYQMETNNMHNQLASLILITQVVP
jgi:hypothetical protein